jgi:hypothetical protein
MSNTDNVIAEIRSLENEFKAGHINAAELKELLEDIKHSKAIAVAADDLALKAQLFELIDGIVVAAGAI